MNPFRLGSSGAMPQATSVNITNTDPVTIATPKAGCRIYVLGLTLTPTQAATLNIRSAANVLAAPVFSTTTNFVLPVNTEGFEFYMATNAGEALVLQSPTSGGFGRALVHWIEAPDGSTVVAPSAPVWTEAPDLDWPSVSQVASGGTYTVAIKNWARYAAGRTVTTIPSSGVSLNTTTGVLTVTAPSTDTSQVAVAVTESGKSISAYTTSSAVRVASASNASETPVLGAPSSNNINLGSSVTIQVTNHNTYVSPEYTFTKANPDDVVTVNASGLITWTPAVTGAGQVLGVQVQEVGKLISGTAVSAGVSVNAIVATTPAPILSGFPTAIQEGLTATGQMTRTGGGNYNASATYQFRTSDDGGATFSSWTNVTGSSIVRISGTSAPYTVLYDIPVVPGNSPTNHRLQIRATDPGSSQSGSSNSAAIQGTVVVDLDPTIDGTYVLNTDAQLVFGFSRHLEGYTGNTCRLRRVSDNAEQNFGFDATGRFDLAAVNTWRAGSAVNFVHFIDQMGTGKLLAASGTIQFCDSAGTVLRHGYTWSNMQDDTAGQITLSNTLGGVGIPLGGSAHLVLTDSGITTDNGVEVFLSASHRERVAVSTSTQPTALSNVTTQKFLMSLGASTSNELQIRMGSSTEMSVYRQGSTAQANIGVPPNGATKRNSYRVRSMGLDATTFWGRHLGRMTTTTANAGNQTNVAGLANGTLRIGSNFAGTGAGCQQLVSAVIVTKNISNAKRFVIEERLKQIAFQHLAMTVQQMVDLFDEWVDWRDVSGDPQTANRTLTGKKNKLTLNVFQSADWTRNFTIPQNGLVGLRRTNMTTTSAFFEATTNYLTDAQEVTAFQFFFEEGDQSSANIWDYWSLAASQTDFSRVAFEIGRDHAGPRMMTTVDPALDPNDRSATQFIATTTNPDQVLGGISQPMAKYSLKLANHGWTPPYTTQVAGTTAVIWGGFVIPIGTVIDNAYMQTNFGVVAGTPELRRWSDTSVAGNARLPYAFANSNAAGQNALQFVAATSQKNPAYNFTVGQEALVRTATNRLYASPFQGTQLGSIDSDVAEAPGTGPHMKAPSTFKICSTSYQGSGRHPQGVYLVTGFAKTPLSMEQLQAVMVNLYKIYTMGYT